VINREVEVARQLVKEGKRDKAKFCLRRKKFQEGLLEKAENNLCNLEEMVLKECSQLIFR
jgi:charged multivesicular body protein 6